MIRIIIEDTDLKITMVSEHDSDKDVDEIIEDFEELIEEFEDKRAGLTY